MIPIGEYLEDLDLEFTWLHSHMLIAEDEIGSVLSRSGRVPEAKV